MHEALQELDLLTLKSVRNFEFYLAEHSYGNYGEYRVTGSNALRMQNVFEPPEYFSALN